ncbi:hypothetical protein NYP18_14765 [Corynebacterium sp. YIM 101645]|uniref:Uncharacterized protein n=1 Tax=Corynebacterium lemuris TaxID=1859292 RepID=A0ABT2G1L6_9CORY|nr:aromatic-ring-hydroxylating dioxygenase subunit beta [Corynebacterium lemuris]MCS5480905.1 hypothetical protein [Corynebacterium lemuris]
MTNTTLQTQMTHSTFLNDERVLRAIQLVWREAALLDRKDYPAWEELFTEEGLYIVPVDPETEDFEGSLNMIYDDKRMRRLRVDRMMQGYAPSAVAAATTTRIVSRFEVLNVSDDEVTIRSAQVLTAYKRHNTDVLGADLTHHIQLGEGDNPDRIIQKIARMINSEDAINAVGFLI